MSNHTDAYSISAKHYDSAYAAKQDLVDLPFYLDLAKRSGGPVLEVACGTGRVLLSIAREEFRLTVWTILPRCCRFLRAAWNASPALFETT